MTDGQNLGNFAVSAHENEVEAFCAATGVARAQEQLPLTFPMRWLMSGEPRRALMALLPEDDLIPFHEGQSFEYGERLLAGVPYQLSLTGQRVSGPERLIVQGVICDIDGAVCARLETTLRLFPASEAAA